MDDADNALPQQSSPEVGDETLAVYAWNDWLRHSMTEKLKNELKDRREATIKYAVHSAINDRKVDAVNALIKIRVLDEVIEYITPVVTVS